MPAAADEVDDAEGVLPTAYPVRRVEADPDAEWDTGRWPATLAPVRQVLADGLDLGACTFLVGENGTGKSTVVEAIAMAYGLSPEGGSTFAMHRTRETESELHTCLRLVRGAGASRWGYFLRAETMHGLFSYLEDHPGGAPEPRFHGLSHGESFLSVLGTSRYQGSGFFVFDEPEAGLSFSAQLALVGSLAAILDDPGAQVLVATHSPVLAALPGATLLELDADGIHRRQWDELDLVVHQRAFLDAPQRYLRHVLLD